MELRRMGDSGLWVSAVGIGCNNFGMRIDESGTKAVVDAAFDAGITFFDTAESYGGAEPGRSEEFLGKALAGRRDDAVVATKFGSRQVAGTYPAGGSRRYVADAVERSLRRLGTDYIDLYYLHRPDPGTPIEETLGALADLVHAGKVRYLGASNFAAWQLADAHHVADRAHQPRFVATQDEWSLLRRRVEREIVPAANQFRIGVVPYFPLASGLLTGKYRRGEDAPEGTRFAAIPPFSSGFSERDWDRTERLVGFADERGHTPLELAMSWLAGQPGVASVIAGATSPEQVAANAASIEWDLTDGDRLVVDELLAAP
jgi:aryl-alcohol dehydrogenase-like predicted oxidoreductase